MSLMRHAVRALMASLLAASLAPSGAEAAAGTVTMRATGPQDLPRLTKLVARETQPILRVGSEADAIAGKTPLQVIRTLCGSVRHDYIREFLAANEAAIREAQRWPLAEGQPLGPLAKSLVWPACLYVIAKPTDVRKRADDTPRTLYTRLTGGDGTDRVLKRYYIGYGKSLAQIDRALNRIPAGGTVVVPYATSVVALTPKDATDTFKHAVKAAAVTSQPADANVRNPIVENGRFVLDVSDDALKADPSHACVANGRPPFDPAAVTRAYNWAFDEHKDRAAQHVGVFVVDNGFFGAGRSINPHFNDTFPQAFFQSARNKEGLTGTVLEIGADKIWPENFLYLQGANPVIPKIDEISGHGTHVAGLVLGGTYIFDNPRKRNYRPILFRDGRSWLDLSIVNIGKGQETPAPGAILGLPTALELVNEKYDIVNLSVEFLGDESNTFQTQFDTLFQRGEDDLFVVAAGNDRKDVQQYGVFPAMRGGQASPNILTVAASAWDGALAFFTNTGKMEIDIAAPGCGITSWLDNKGTVRALNGTSQATPLVTFAAALVKSLDESLKPADIKTRLIVSGDLIEPKPGKTQPWSLARLDIPAALYLWDDYLRIDPSALPGPHSAAPREFLGTLVDVTSAVCVDEGDAKNFRDIWSVKSGRLGQFLYTGRRFNKLVRGPCQLDLTAKPTVIFKPAQEIVGGKFMNWPSDQLTIPVAKVQSMVRAVEVQ